MKRSLIVVVLVLVAFAASAEVTGAGVDLYASLQTTRVAPDVDPTTDTYIVVTGSLMYMLDEGTELNPFVGIILEREGAGELFNPVDRQLGVQLGTGYYVTFIVKQPLAFSVGPQVGVQLFGKPAASGLTTYIDLRVYGDLYLNMDLNLMNDWLLRFGVGVMDMSFSYQKRDDVVWTTWVADSQLVKGSALISLRKLF